MKFLLLTIIITVQIVLINSTSTSPQNLTWLEPYRELNNMIMCDKYWTNHSQYLCLDQDYFDFEHYWQKGFKKCRCDSECHHYQDCCLDKAYLSKGQSSALTTTETCVSIPSTRYSIFMVSKCDVNWNGNEEIRNLCEVEFELDEVEDILSYMVPVHSKMTKKFYKNVYCAACNFDNDHLTEWDIVTKYCQNDNTTATDGRHGVQLNVSSDNEWILYWYGEKCLLLINQLEIWIEFYHNFKPRPCALNYVSTCTSPERKSAQHCPNYLAPVYYIGRHNKLEKIFKNYHCADCNNAKTSVLRKIVCEDYDIQFSVYDCSWTCKDATRLSHGTNMKMLLNFNFANGKLVYADSKCKNGNEVYESSLRRCVAITCGKLYVEKRGRCVLKDNDTANPNRDHSDTEMALKSDCKKAILFRNEFVMLPNKTIIVASGKLLPQSKYEVDYDENGTILAVLICAENVLKIIDFDTSQRILSQVCLIISVVCLGLHLIVYSILPSLRNLPGKTLMSMSASLAVADSLFLIGSNFDHKPSACHIIGVLKHYAYLAVFFWTNIMALDIHRTFSTNSVTRLSNSSKTFFKYSIYAWVSPAGIVLIAVLIDTFLNESVFKPKYGQGICWISQRQPLLIFFAIPMAILLICNGVLFILTAKNINATVKQTKMASRFSDKLRFILYVKLATILGVTWIFGFLAAVANVDVLWYPFILFTGLQGVIIFVAFTCKRKIWHSLRQLFNNVKSSKDKRGYLRDKSKLNKGRSMATSATSLSSVTVSNSNKVSIERDASVSPVRHPRVDYIRVNST